MTILQANMQVQDDLAALFSRNLTLDPVQVQAPVPAPPKEEEAQITYSISQHYHHSSHIARQAQQQDQQQPPPQRPASEPPHPEYQATESILIAHGVDASALSAAQLELFKTADDPQKLRLIELWRICPPTSSNDNPTLAWSSTTVDQEELLARMRFERRLQEEQQSTTMSLDGTPVPTPAAQADNGRWVLPQGYMEPYMSSGYEELARREYLASMDINSYKPATDPVYKAVGGDWTQQGKMAAMENQYGALMAMRESEMEI